MRRTIILIFSSLMLVGCSSNNSGHVDADTGGTLEAGTNPTDGAKATDGNANADQAIAPTHDGATNPTSDGTSHPGQDQGVALADVFPTHLDSGPAVPSDPMICKDCTANGQADCVSSNSNTYMCVGGWYQPAGGTKIYENYCTRHCETLACPDQFTCENVTIDQQGHTAKVCMPPDHMCGMLQ